MVCLWLQQAGYSKKHILCNCNIKGSSPIHRPLLRFSPLFQVRFICLNVKGRSSPIQMEINESAIFLWPSISSWATCWHYLFKFFLSSAASEDVCFNVHNRETEWETGTERWLAERAFGLICQEELCFGCEEPSKKKTVWDNQWVRGKPLSPALSDSSNDEYQHRDRGDTSLN